MLAKLLDWFEAPQQAPEELSADEAATVLMVEIMLADHDLDEREADLIAERLAKRTGDDKATATALVQKAQERHSESPDLYPFTRVINDHFDEDQKYALVVDLWRTALADNTIDKLEEHMIRRIADMLYLHHSHFIQAKREAQQES
ncbi:hypothetical protein BGP77_06390 [Saccharospirillum sp. MSK14-1]|uniref:tellurite resistance TerB family protein n=1 Tax=Saccharospirillum sp. MSK14-1 TaxID=1897632 RepID=UPI000D38F61F|nr:TerB family tellurite resistance protein [Saccharospirillum sp. MSK14-1]PTY36909.1 hypothetical protein BGP77_06390 [Saccharospirillum sp. MSK14-1]